MANVSPATFWTQADALLRKNLTYQKRNKRSNIFLISFPMLICYSMVSLQSFSDDVDKVTKCGCKCANNTSGDQCPKVCGVQYSDTPFQALNCEIPKPLEWPPLLQLPETGPRPVNMLFTAQNRSFAQSVFGNMFPSASTTSLSDRMEDSLISLDSLATYVLGTTRSSLNNFFEYGFSMEEVVYLQTQCRKGSFISFQLQGFTGSTVAQAVCAQGILSWRNSSSEINNEIFKKDVTLKETPPARGVLDKKDEIASAFDFLNSNGNRFNVTIWYNSADRSEPSDSEQLPLLRIPRYVNLISNAYLQFLRGPGTKMLFEFVKEMPKHETLEKMVNWITSFVGGLLFTFVVLQLFPVVLTSLVYEKEQKLRIMMKMHGLGDGAYWTISYGYFLAVSMIYMLCFVICGSFLGIKFFTLNDYSIQFVFFMVYINLQIAVAFLTAPLFSNVKTASVTGNIAVSGSALIAQFLFNRLVQDATFPRGWIIFMELYPVFALNRGLFEFGQYAEKGGASGTVGMQWKDVSDSANGMKEVLIVMLAEWIVVLFVAYYIDQVFSSGSGKSPLFFLKSFQKKPPSASRKPSIQRKLDEMEKPDVIQEREKVGQILQEPTNNHAIVCDDLKKVYPGMDGNPDKFAVKGLFLAVPRGECFGMLGPNGAGKTSFISMMIGLTKPSSGSAFVEGLDINTDMDGIYTSMGVCPQHDLLWETLTGREHLLFYGRLKNLQGSALTEAIEESLKTLNLFHGGVADKQCGKYSGGMKRRLSVAISLIGDPKVVYMDEPSTGLDPASRNCLWNVIRLAKQNRAIILTTHSMEEAEFLCDRLGIFVDGQLQCVGNPKELKGRYGGTYVFTMTTSSDHEEDVENMVQQLTPNANRIYCLSGTQKFELPKDEVRIADVFRAVDAAKRNFTVSAWGLADTTLEDVFIKVARGAQIFQT